VVLKDNFGEATEAVVNLETALSAVFNMREQADTKRIKINRGTATISNAANGEVTYQWQAGDTDTSGIYDAEVEVTWSDGDPETFPSGPSAGTFWEILISDEIA
jgi:hypothetical protein